ncbi:hypothetical protein [Clostridium tarantellae]|uniref:Uncharacterized protein n=1 Tax=Clostridium tarantellae TaxID=39493 RepID=A0A6I1MM13_9CLOT|nr:hypothetical protein [Clostridium tarantellae]MPQ43478.1 hypothetical protein [Clostridium tarantellae]
MEKYKKEIHLENKYLSIEDYIDFAFKNLNNIRKEYAYYEEVFLNKELNNKNFIDYKNYIEEAFGANWNKKFDNISLVEYDILYSKINK